MKLSVFYEHVREASEQTGESLEAILNKARNAGISGIEMEYSTLKSNPELLDAIKNAYMEISCFYQFFDFGKDFRGGIKLGKRMIDDAVLMGVKRVMIIPGFLDDEKAHSLIEVSDDWYKTRQVMRKMRETAAMKRAVGKLAKYAAKKNIVPCMEDFDAFNSPIARLNQLRFFTDDILELGHALDTGNYVFSDEDVKDAYMALKSRIVHVHCKDRGQEKETIDTNWLSVPTKNRKGLKPVPVGNGYMPIKEIVENVIADGYEGYFAIEHFGAPDQSGYMLQSARYLKSLATVKCKA